jgi:hypothetical protein
MRPHAVNPPLVVGLAVACALGLVLLWVAGKGPEAVHPPAGSTPDPPPVAPSPPVVQVDYTPPPHRSSPDQTSRRHMFRLPDGQYVPSLNGAVDAAPMDWPADRPYSPIVGRERDAKGFEWYVHGDGTKSTTVMTYRPELGRMDALTRIAHPTPAGRIVDDTQQPSKR